MVARVTNTLTQIALAALAAVAFIYPSPEDAINAARDAISPEEVDVSIKADDILIEPIFASAPERVQIDQVYECLRSGSDSNYEGLVRCAEILHEDLLTQEKPVAVQQFEKLIGRDQTDRNYENQRLTIARICRAIWASSGGDPDALSTPACYMTVLGVEKPA